jgi:hypothetical protein
MAAGKLIAGISTGGTIMRPVGVVPMTAWGRAFARLRTTAAALLAACTLAAGDVSTARAQFQGPLPPTSRTNDASIGALPWVFPVPEEAAAFSFGFGTTMYLEATAFGFSISNAAVITGIQVDVERSALAFSTSDNAVRIVKGGTIGTTDKSAAGAWPYFYGAVVTYGGDGDLWGETWTAADIEDPGFGFAISAANVSEGVAITAISITVFHSGCGNDAECADGSVCTQDSCDPSMNCVHAPALDCDDGNLCTLDSCHPSLGCVHEAGPPCDDANLCTEDSCDPSLGCVYDASPIGGCRMAQKSTLILKDTSDERDKLLWKWVKGMATSEAEFGVPAGTTLLCIYAGTSPGLVADYVIPGGAAQWAPIGSTGHRYTDRSGGEDGITKVVLKGSSADNAKCVLKGKGVELADLDLTALVDPITVQLSNSASSVCFESTFAPSDFVTFGNPSLFKAKTQ